MNIHTLTMGQAEMALLAASPALGRDRDDHRAGILLRVATLLSGLFYAPAKGRLVISDPNLIPDSNGLWTPAQVSQAIRRAHGSEFGEEAEGGRRDKRSGLFVPAGATTTIGQDRWKNYSPSVMAGSKPVGARGAAFRTGVVQGMLRPALRDHLTAKNAAGNVVRARIPGGDVAATYIKNGALVGSGAAVIVTAYRLDPAVTGEGKMGDYTAAKRARIMGR